MLECEKVNNVFFQIEEENLDLESYPFFVFITKRLTQLFFVRIRLYRDYVEKTELNASKKFLHNPMFGSHLRNNLFLFRS